MVKESYVSFETAKLLKKKRFDEPCDHFYRFDSKELFRGTMFTNSQIGEKFHNAPTQQMAMRWLREVHNIGIFPSTYTITNSEGSKEEHVYGSAIVNLITFDLMCDDIMSKDSYEEACEVAIKYCLENLI